MSALEERAGPSEEGTGSDLTATPRSARNLPRPSDDRPAWRPPSAEAERARLALDRLLAPDHLAVAAIKAQTYDGVEFWISLDDLAVGLRERGAA